MSLDLYNRLNAVGGVTLSPVEQQAIASARRELDMFAFEFGKFVANEGLRPVFPAAVSGGGRIIYADGRHEWDQSLSGYLGRAWDYGKQAVTVVGDALRGVATSPNSYELCKFVFEQLQTALLAGPIPFPGGTATWQGAFNSKIWEESVNKSFANGPVEGTCRLIWPKGEVPPLLRQLGSVIDAHDPLLGDLAAVDVPVAELAQIALGDLLAEQVSIGAVSGADAEQWLRSVTGVPDATVPVSYAPPSNGFQVASALPLDLDLTLWTDGGPMAGHAWATPETTVEVNGTSVTWRSVDLWGDTTVTTKQGFDDGSSLTTVQRPDGTVSVETRDADGRVTCVTQEQSSAGRTLRITYDADGLLVQRATITQTAGGGSKLTEVDADGGYRVTEFDAAGQVISTREVGPLAAAMERQTPVLNDLTSLLVAIRNGDELPALASGLRLINHVDQLDGAAIPYLDGASKVVSGVASLYNLANALEHGDSLDKVYAAANAVVQVNTALQATGLGSEVLNGFVEGSGIGEAVPYLGALVALKNGDYTGAAVGFAAAYYNIPYIGWIYAAYSLITAMGDEPPEAWGMGRAVFEGADAHDASGRIATAVTAEVTGDSFGVQRVQAGLHAALSALQTEVDRANAAAGRPVLGLIPQRLPSLTWREGRQDDPGYALGLIDPLTGEQQYPFLRWDDDMMPFSAEPGLYQPDPSDPNVRDGWIVQMLRNAVERGAIAPLWEVQTARLQQQAGDPDAGLSEAERAARRGLLAPIDAATGQRVAGPFRPVMLDLDGSGALALVGKDDPGNDVAFDWDDSGYLKQTGWLRGTDGFLFLDRNLNGRVDAGSELFSNSMVSDSVRGVRSLAWVDADGDGLITSMDPVFNQLRVWQDLDRDGDNVTALADGTMVEDAGEIHTLAQLGITQLDPGNGRFLRDGEHRALASPALEADANGLRVNVVQGGLFIEDSDGTQRLVVTQVVSAVDGSDTVNAFEDGALQAEESRAVPRPIDIAHALLLANDSPHPGALTLTSVMNATHGTVALGQGEQAGFVIFTPEADFHGQASFQYVASDAFGQGRTFDVTVSLTPVADTPVVQVLENEGRAVYGYRPVHYSYTQYVYAMEDTRTIVTTGTALGDPIYAPYVEEVPGAPIYQQVFGSTGYEDILVGYEPSTFIAHDIPIAWERATAGQLLASDADGASTFSFQMVSAPVYGRVTLNPDGSWAYEAYRPNGVAVGDVDGDRIVDYANPDTGLVYSSNPGNAYLANRYGGSELDASFDDSFIIRVTDGGGDVSDQVVTVRHHGPRPLANVEMGSKKPIAIDLDGDGFHFTDVDDSNVFFDVNGDGWRRRTSWLEPDDGLLAIDRDGDGRISSGKEIAFVGDLAGAQTDLEGLAAFDTDGDRRLTSADRDWAKFGVWRDADSDGVSDEGEFLRLDAMGILAIGLDRHGQFQVIDGQSVHGLATVTRSDGSTLQAADVSLRYRNEVLVGDGSGSGAARVVTMPTHQPGQHLVGSAGDHLMLGTEGSDSYHAHEGDDVVVDDAGNDMVDAGTGDDMVATGQGDDMILLGDGDDTAYAGEGNDMVFGDGEGVSGNDLLLLEGGNDIAFGGDGDDFIGGGEGNDVLSGDGGHDKLFGEGGWDALLGQEGDDELWGLEGDDQLFGGLGNDLLAGGAGNDHMDGGEGDDTYEVGAVGDVVRERPGEGVDDVLSSIDFVLGDELEHLTLTGVAGRGIGNAQANTLVGNDADNLLIGLQGDDTLDGGGGGDEMRGGEGDDTYVVGEAADLVVEQAGEGFDTVRSRIAHTLAAHIEVLELTGLGAIDGTGNRLDNILLGNASANMLDGGEGADRMSGGDGNDTYRVDHVGDTVVEQAGQGYDTVIVSIGGRHALSDHVESLRLGDANGSGMGNGADNLLTAGHGDHLLAGLGGNDILDGGAGHDVLDGGTGADLLIGGAGDDRHVVDDAGDAVTERAGEGVDVVMASVSHGLGAHVEHLVLAGTGPLDGQGNALDNVLVGNGGVNTLHGGDGRDVLAGGLGDDVLDGGTGDDLYLYHQGEGRDLILDASGIDTLRLGPGITWDSLAGRVVTVGNERRLFLALLDTDGQETGRGVEVALGVDGQPVIERVQLDDGRTADLSQLIVQPRTTAGTDGADIVTGDRSDDTVFAGLGADTVYGRSGHDTLYGGVGMDRLFGEGGNDRLYGETEADQLWGGAGDDQLWGGSGADTLAGGHGNDLLMSGVDNDLLDGGDGADVLDGDSGQDQLFGGAGDDVLRGGTDLDVLAAGDGDDVIESGSGTAVVVGGRGNDRITTDTNADFVDAGGGDDLIVTSTGNDFIAAGRGADRIDAGQDRDVIAFNRGDGTDTVVMSTWQADALSLGGGIRYADMALRKSGNHLVLDLGEGDAITLEGWYQDASRRNIKTLQVITGAAGGDYLQDSSDRLINRKVVAFNFEQLVARFDAARVADSTLSTWRAGPALDGAYLRGSDTQAIGGDMAWRHGTTGSYGDLDWLKIATRLGGMSSQTWQTLTTSTLVNPWTALQAGLGLTEDATVGLPSPITPLPPPTSDALVFAALTAAAPVTGVPAWMGVTPAPLVPQP